jgi:hypothetical protein
MGEAELKAKLERAIGGISTAEWLYLRNSNVLLEHDELPWSEFREWADEVIQGLRDHVKNTHLENAGVLETEVEVSAEQTTPIANESAELSDRTSARSTALAALDRLRAKAIQTRRARILTGLFPRGGTDRTVPQWVIMLAVEAWIPAEEVKERYSEIQRRMLAEKSPPKTSERSFHVAKFVWEQELFYGTRPPWRVLKERWNALPWAEAFEWAKPFDTWQAFRMSFERGKKATPPQYTASEEQLTELVRSRTHEGALDAWADKLRE